MPSDDWSHTKVTVNHPFDYEHFGGSFVLHTGIVLDIRPRSECVDIQVYTKEVDQLLLALKASGAEIISQQKIW